MHISTTTSRYKDRTYHCHMLRETYVDEDGKRQKHTLANLSRLDPRAIELLKAHLGGKTLVEADHAYDIIDSRIHGPVMAVTKAFEQLGMADLISSAPSRQRDLVCALIAARIIRPHTKLSTVRWWNTTTLADSFGVADVEVDEVYAAMDWLLRRKNRIQGKLARRLLGDSDLVLYDLSSSYFEGSCCSLARYGYSRDGKRGKLQVNYGLLCDRWGRPVSISVHAGDVSDTATVPAELNRLHKRFSLSKVVVVGDRGMIAQAQIDALRQYSDFSWITALKGSTIRKLMRKGVIDTDDSVSLVEVHHPDYPGERLVVCRNPALATRRAHKRESLLAATEEVLRDIQSSVRGARLKGAAEIGLKVGQHISRYRMRKHFVCEIDDHSLSFHRDERSIEMESRLDGVYVIRTSVSTHDMSAADCVRGYKSLCQVERAFRTIKTMHLRVRPIHHRLADRVRAHLFLCMLAYYVEWHMCEVWRPLTFADTQLRGDTSVRDPVAAAQRSESALRKVRTGLLDDGTPAHSFQTLMENLGTITWNRCRISGSEATFEMVTKASEWQEKAISLLDGIRQLRQKVRL